MILAAREPLLVKWPSPSAGGHDGTAPSAGAIATDQSVRAQHCESLAQPATLGWPPATAGPERQCDNTPGQAGLAVSKSKLEGLFYSS